MTNWEDFIVGEAAQPPQNPLGDTALTTALSSLTTRNGWVNVKDVGAAGDGITDDTDILNSIIHILGDAGGGTLFFPLGEYRANILVDRDNIHFEGESFLHSQLGGVAIVPYTSTDPALTVGDGSTSIEGFTADKISLHGDSATHDKGLLVQGANRCTFKNFASSFFADYAVRITSTASVSTYFIWFDDFLFSAASGDTLQAAYGSTFTTAIFFTNGVISTSSTADNSAVIDGVHLRQTQVWWEFGDGTVPILLNSTGGTTAIIEGSGIMLDSPLSTDVLIELDTNDHIQDHFHGVILMDGVVKFGDTTTAAISGGGELLRFNSRISYPWVMGWAAFADTAAANNVQHAIDSLCRIYQGLQQQLILEGEKGVWLGPDVADALSEGVATVFHATKPVLRLYDGTDEWKLYLESGNAILESPAGNNLILRGSGGGAVQSETEHTFLTQPAIDGDDDVSRHMSMKTNGSLRWTMGTTADGETGSDAGTDFHLTAFDDSGTQLSIPIRVTRSTGKVWIDGDLEVGGTFTN